MIILVWIIVLIFLLVLLTPRIASESTDVEDITDWLDYCVFASNSPVLSIYRYEIEFSDDPIIRERQDFVFHQCERFGADPSECLAIIPCEGNFYDPELCNRAYGCKSGQGPWMFIESTWFSTITRMIKAGIDFPDRCKVGDQRGDFECNAIAGAWLLDADENGHWLPYSGSCFLAKLK